MGKKKKQQKKKQKKQKKPKKRQNVLTRHHKRPASRGGKKTQENIKWIPMRIHKAYNWLFTNLSLSPKIIILILRKLGRNNFIKDRKPKSQPGFLEAWKTLFNKKTDEKIIKIIESDFSNLPAKPKRKLFSNFNLTPEEIILVLKQFGRNIFLENRHTKNKKFLHCSWKMLFGDKTDGGIIEIIKKEWT